MPLPFVVNQDSTFTIDDDYDVQVKGSGKGDLRKRQFTMHLFCNAGTGEDRGGYTVLIGRGKLMMGNRFIVVGKSSLEYQCTIPIPKICMGRYSDIGRNCTGICGIRESEA